MTLQQAPNDATSARVARPGAKIQAGRRHATADLLYRALGQLERFGYPRADPAHIAAAHALGRCYLCHSQYAHTIDGCPCPHWVLMAWPTSKHLEATYASSGFARTLQYLVQYLSSSTEHYRGQVVRPSVHDDLVELSLQFRSRRWTFSLGRDEQGAHTIRMALKTRSPDDIVVRMTAAGDDVALFQAIIGATVAHPSYQNEH